MPFTVTHIIAVLPFAARRNCAWPFSALALGSMIPDLPLFVPFAPAYERTHSLPGIFIICVPVGLLTFGLFQAIMKRPLCALLPVCVQKRIAPVGPPCIKRSPAFWLWVIVALLLGAVTHVAWDAFTHSDGLAVRLNPALSQPAFTFAGHAVPWFKALQYGSSLLGLPVLAGLLFFWLRRQAVHPITPELPWTLRAGGGLVAALIPLLVTNHSARVHGLTTYQKIGWSITTSGLALLLAAMVYSLVFQCVRLLQRTRARRTAHVPQHPRM